jgi:putative oxidoreductase
LFLALPQGAFLNRQEIEQCYHATNRWLRRICLSLVLLFFRIFWGWGLYQAGKGKLGNIQRPIGFFKDLHIPAPVFNAWLVSIVECVGGAMIFLGIGARFAAVAIVIDMIVAYVAADREAIVAMWTDQEMGKFMERAPFWFLVSSLIVLALGPGLFSIDAVIKRLFLGPPRDPARTIPSSRLD